MFSSKTASLAMEPSSAERSGKKTLRERCGAMLMRRVPVLRWARTYSREDAACDAVAGVTVGLTLMPQAIAYAGLAGLAAQHGLYSAFAGQLLYILFGTIKQVSIGPTSLMAILASSYTRGLPADFMVLLALLAGCVELLMGLLNLGFLVDFISTPVVSGFTSATSVIIVSTQLRGLFGLRGYEAHGFFDSVWQAMRRCCTGNIGAGDTLVGLTCVCVLLALRQLASCGANIEPRVRRALWFVSISRNALVVVACSTIAWFYETRGGGAPFRLSPEVPSGLPALRFPNTTVQFGDVTYTFWDMCNTLGTGILFVPLVAVLANVAIAKSFASGRMVDAGQEMITLGVCNIAGSMVQAMPTCGAFTRSAVSEASGIRTPLAGAYSGTLILLALTYLTPYFHYIPSACLSAVLITAVIFMVDWRCAVRLWRNDSRADLLVLVLTFCVSLWRGVESGLVAGTCASACLVLLAPWCRPHVHTQVAHGYVIVSPELGLLYPGVDRVRMAVQRACTRNVDVPVLLDCSRVLRCDYTALRGLAGLLGEQPRVHLAHVSDDLRARLLAVAPSVSPRLYRTLLDATTSLAPQEKTPLLDHQVHQYRSDSRKQSLYENLEA